MAKTKEELFDEVNLLAQEVGEPLLPESDKYKYKIKELAELVVKYEEQKVSRFKHCDDYIHDLSQPKCLRFFLLVNRLPAADTMLLRENGVVPQLFADHKGSVVRVTMASRFGDVGISYSLNSEDGYSTRVAVADLSNFSATTTLPPDERLPCGCRAGRRHSKSNCLQGLPSDPA